MLSGTRVVELGLWVAGPGAGGVLADWGAEVIKVEPPEGDPMRAVLGTAKGRVGPGYPLFDLDNRGKYSVVLDLGAVEERARLDRLIATADVFLTNLRPGVLERLGFDHRTLLERHPRLVYASVTAYGLTGPDRELPGYDLGAFWARSGAADLIVPPEDEPPSSSLAFGDHITGLTTVAGIMAALYHRERTGSGQLVATSLLRTGIYCVSADLAIRQSFGTRAPTAPRTAVGNPLMNRYRAGDGKWFFLIGVEPDRHWPNLVAALEAPELAADTRFADARSRRHNVEAVVAALDERFATRTRDEWARRFAAADVWWAPVASADEVLADPQARAAGAFVEVPDGDGTTFASIATPVDFGTVAARPRGPVPRLGQHTAQVLAELR